MRQHLGHVQIAVAGTNLRQRFCRLKTTAAATADVIPAEQRPLRAGKFFQHRAHGGLGINIHSKKRRSRDAIIPNLAAQPAVAADRGNRASSVRQSPRQRCDDKISAAGGMAGQRETSEAREAQGSENDERVPNQAVVKVSARSGQPFVKSARPVLLRLHQNTIQTGWSRPPETAEIFERQDSSLLFTDNSFAGGAHFLIRIRRVRPVHRLQQFRLQFRAVLFQIQNMRCERHLIVAVREHNRLAAASLGDEPA